MTLVASQPPPNPPGVFFNAPQPGMVTPDPYNPITWARATPGRPLAASKIAKISAQLLTVLTTAVLLTPRVAPPPSPFPHRRGSDRGAMCRDAEISALPNMCGNL